MNDQRQLSVASHFHSNELALMDSKSNSNSKNHKSSFNNHNEDDNNEEDEEEDDREYMELTVLEAKGLPKADVFGSSDPYVIVKWDTGDDVWSGDEGNHCHCHLYCNCRLYYH